MQQHFGGLTGGDRDGGGLQRRRGRGDADAAGLRRRLHNREAEPIERLAVIHLVAVATLRVAIVYADEFPLALHVERDLVLRRGDHAPLLVENLHHKVRNIATVRGYLSTVCRQTDGGGFSGGGNLHGDDGNTVPGAHGFERSRLVRHIPGEVQIGRGPQPSVAGRNVSVTILHPVTGKLVAAHADRTAVDEELDGVAVGVAGDRDELAFPALPVPVWEKVDHWLGGPLALVEVEAVLGEAAGVDGAGGRRFGGPPGLAEVVDAGPHEIAGDVVIGADELQIGRAHV